jgi:hypothetical protein
MCLYLSRAARFVAMVLPVRQRQTGKEGFDMVFIL